MWKLFLPGSLLAAAIVDRLKTRIVIFTVLVDDIAAAQVGLALRIGLIHAAFISRMFFFVVHDPVLSLMLSLMFDLAMR
jgi:hypothetical protein